ncbi:hypothetical protein HAX54_007708, partial [Datura stramonium]|nr:hypothetical protein [Datura stramonium]
DTGINVADKDTVLNNAGSGVDAADDKTIMTNGGAHNINEMMQTLTHADDVQHSESITVW